jgi:hypothetical protein
MKTIAGIPTPDAELPAETSSNVPYEAVPELAANETFVDLMEEARKLKVAVDRDSARLEEIRIEAGALIAIAGQKSVAYQDIRVVNIDGGTTKGKITGAGLLDAVKQLLDSGVIDHQRVAALVQVIALSAKDCDPEILVVHGFPPDYIEGARGQGSYRSGSTKFEWVGGKGKGAKSRAAGSGGTIQ